MYFTFKLGFLGLLYSRFPPYTRDKTFPLPITFESCESCLLTLISLRNVGTIPEFILILFTRILTERLKFKLFAALNHVYLARVFYEENVCFNVCFSVCISKDVLGGKCFTGQ